MSGINCWYYNQSQSNNNPFDYPFWPREKTCPPKSCAPQPPPILKTKKEIDAYEAKRPLPHLKRILSQQEKTRIEKEKKIESFLIQAKKDGWLVEFKKGERGEKETVNYILRKGQIRFSRRNTHILFGTAHGIEGPTVFFNQLIIRAKEKFGIKGKHHIVLPRERNFEGAKDPFCKNDAQCLIDWYLRYGVKKFEPLESLAYPNTNQPIEPPQEVEAQNRTIDLARQNCFDIILAEFPRTTGRAIKQRLGIYYWVASREIYSAKAVAQRTDPHQRNIFWWKVGESHIEKRRQPRQIKILDPKAITISVILDGGSYIPRSIFHRVLKKLGWLDKTFVLKLNGYLETDYVIHFPTILPKSEYDNSLTPDMVFQDIIDPP